MRWLTSPHQKIYEFEGFRLDAAHLLLYREDEEIALAPKVVETLLVLVENQNRIISKEELMQRVWSDAVVEENNLSQNPFRLRKVLGETSGGRPFIETLRRCGYRFVAKARVVEGKPATSGSGDGYADDPDASLKHPLYPPHSSLLLPQIPAKRRPRMKHEFQNTKTRFAILIQTARFGSRLKKQMSARFGLSF